MRDRFDPHGCWNIDTWEVPSPETDAFRRDKSEDEKDILFNTYMPSVNREKKKKKKCHALTEL